MRATWSGNLSIAQISFPVKVYPARESRGIEFNLIHPPCQSRIKYQIYCPSCQAAVERAELKRGYEYEKGRYVILDQEDFDRLPLMTIKTITILGFTRDSIDPRAFDDVYYLAPDTKKQVERVSRIFQFLYKLMERKGVKAIGKVAMREKEKLCVISAFGGIFLLQTLCYEGEVRDFRELVPGREAQFSEQEIEMGERLVDEYTMAFDWEAFEDEYRKALEKMIEAKIEGREIVTAKEAEAPAGDLVAQLLASMGMK